MKVCVNKDNLFVGYKYFIHNTKSKKKASGPYFNPPKHWVLREESILVDDNAINTDINKICGKGINFFSVNPYFHKYPLVDSPHLYISIWQVEVPKNCKVVVPNQYNSSTKVRATRLRLVKNLFRGSPPPTCNNEILLIDNSRIILIYPGVYRSGGNYRHIKQMNVV